VTDQKVDNLDHVAPTIAERTCAAGIVRHAGEIAMSAIRANAPPTPMKAPTRPHLRESDMTEPTETQPAPNVSTEHADGDGAVVAPTTTQPAPNLSTEHQKPGDARVPGDQLDRERKPQDDGGRKSSLTGDA
jgi:hypothetical protein